jgi:hypothetical protein
MLFCIAAMTLVKRRHDSFVNPLTKAMRRPPGTQLGRELGREQLEVGFSCLEMTLSAIVPISVFVQFQNRLHETTPMFLFVVVIIGWAIWLVFATVKFVNRFHRIKQLRLGYECELAVGQELDLLMLNGFRVFHDVPAGKFNIDHIVIGPPGVFAVETKGRSKIISGDGKGKKQFRVAYKDGVLHFPNGVDREAVPQARRQGKWVAQWLSQSTGQSVEVRPLVILPGWFVETQDKTDIPVIASGYIQGYFLGQKQSLLSEKKMTQIVYQIDQKVRDLDPGEVVRPVPE